LVNLIIEALLKPEIDEELKKSIKNLVYALEYIYKKETIEIE